MKKLSSRDFPFIIMDWISWGISMIFLRNDFYLNEKDAEETMRLRAP